MLNMKDQETKRLFSVITMTAVVCFTISILVYGGLMYFNGSYSLTFNKKSVDRSTIQKFNEARSILQKAYYENVDTNKLVEGAISGMTDSLNDPYTVYYNKKQMKWFTGLQNNTENEYVGVGLPIMLDKNGVVTVLEPYDNSPAKAAGIKQGDKILKIDGKDITGIKDETLIASMIKGPENTETILTILRESESSTKDIPVMRKKIKALVNIRSEMLDGNIAYIKLKMFDKNISKNFISQLNTLVKQGAKGLIIDVRDNPGGLYDEVVSLADRLLPEGTIVFTKDKNGKKNVQPSDATELNMPIAVLTNGNSASASEILAGAIKDFKKGTLIGTKTFGKGLVQTTYSFKDGTGLKVTIARYYTPSGVCIQGQGIKPDIEINLPDKYKDTDVATIPKEDDLQLQKAIEVINQK
ncbi:carboxyl-terminal protease [Ruminiclostridium papyrosolvens DSM 2782]|uniref:Carboxyl-terminal protease n=1 Tax=Ruminiclostridium papyrosolvens DSM 2782 TaxID=588581 RepID=F1TGU4_9FIRM|nr:S41 family peptidase [Ruminiclostridium papyrosolvens]EGD46425.1 carboxyl-terminal protease [Ruminiclostridium papyrosolvens DSM 2782]WES33962.1 S41 family peptidase [Ruminiclostridium papyrosolvens DSM 2782]